MTQHLDVAQAIGQSLVRSAVWHDERCNWIGPDEKSPGTLSALGSSLYDGTGGIGYFLAELYAETHAPEFKRTAAGALRQALARAEADGDGDGDGDGDAGMYTGSTGLAVAAIHAGVLLDQDSLVRQAIRLVDRPADGHGDADLLSGLAGRVLGLLILSGMLARTDLVERAGALADRLLATVIAGDGWYCWAPPKGASSRPLAGISHGAAGIGQALLELSHRTGEARYRRVGELAFAYERHLFDPVRRNWPDLRDVPRRANRRGASFMSTWCHGAPGIALSRLRAYQLYRDEACRDEAVEGIAATSRTLDHALSTRSGNYSLCHGLAGNGEVLWQAGEILGDTPGWTALVEKVAEAGLEHHAQRDRPWPCGTRQGTTPSLMCGLAGIGLFYLRLHKPSVPSILLLKPGAFARAA
jgi:lantibiotic biosynthesis protein